MELCRQGILVSHKHRPKLQKELKERKNVQLIFHNLLVLVSPGVKQVGPPSCITNTPQHLKHSSSTLPDLVTDLHNVKKKKRGLPQIKQIFIFSYSMIQYTHHSSSAKERERGRELKVRSQWDSYGTKERVATNARSRVVFTSPLHLVKQVIGTHTAC